MKDNTHVQVPIEYLDRRINSLSREALADINTQKELLMLIEHFPYINPSAQQQTIKELVECLEMCINAVGALASTSGYIGESTRSEINYAIANNKPVKYLE